LRETTVPSLLLDEAANGSHNAPKRKTTCSLGAGTGVWMIILMSTGLANTLKTKNSGKSVFGLKNKNNFNKN